MRKIERDYLNDVAQLDCTLCGKSGPSTVHHIRAGQGMGQRAPHFLVAALCHDCHQGPQGLHGDRTLLRVFKRNELDLLAETMERVYESAKR